MALRDAVVLFRMVPWICMSCGSDGSCVLITCVLRVTHGACCASLPPAMLLSLSSYVLLLAAVVTAETDQAVLSDTTTRPGLHDKRLVQLSQDPLDVQWMSFEDRYALKTNGGFYKDV